MRHALLFLAGCHVSGVDQKSDAVIIDYTVPNRTITTSPSLRSEKLLIGTVEKGKDHRVPVLVEWTVDKDNAGCLRFHTVRIVRQGGPTSTEIYNPGVRSLDPSCTTRLDARDPFDRISVSYCWRWNGATNKDDCAYSGGFTISADPVGLEGPVDRVK
jgi:hypothetical protein